MGDVKMTCVLVSTSQFVATLTYPIKIKTQQALSKHSTITVESTDALIEVTPVVHTPEKLKKRGESLSYQFYKCMAASSSQDFRRVKEETLQHFLENCGEKIRREIKESLNEEALQSLAHMNVDNVIVNYIDKDGRLANLVKNTVDDVMWAVSHMKVRLITWPSPKPSLSLAPPPPSPKPRRKERIGPREGGIRRFMSSYTTRK